MQMIQTWITKFAVAFRGLGISLRDQSSLQMHVLAAALVLTLATCMLSVIPKSVTHWTPPPRQCW